MAGPEDRERQQRKGEAAADDRTIEMRVAELEDKLSQLTISEDELETFRKVAKVARAAQARGLGPKGGFKDLLDFCDIVDCELCVDFCEACEACEICIICFSALQGPRGGATPGRESRALHRFRRFGR